MPQNAGYDKSLHCLQVSGLDILTGSNMDMFKFKARHDKEVTEDLLSSIW